MTKHLRGSFGPLAFFAFALCLQSSLLSGQTNTTMQGTAHPPAASAPHHKHHRRARHAAKVAPVPVAVPTPLPPAPVYPVPPGLQPAVDATVTFSNNQLTIDAKNASLIQILHEVTRLTGMTVTGLSGDTRVYGVYGPGTVDDTLRQLLNGGPYNFVISGGDEHHPPTQLEFTTSN